MTFPLFADHINPRTQEEVPLRKWSHAQAEEALLTSPALILVS